MKNQLLFFSIFIFLISQTIFQNKQNKFSNQISNQIQKEFIVSFNEYKPIDYWNSYIYKIIKNLKGCEIVNRNSLAIQYPTDFILIRINLEKKEEIFQKFEKNKQIRSISENKEIKQQIQSITEEIEEEENEEEKFISINKRSHTKFSFEGDDLEEELENEEKKNERINQRKILKNKNNKDAASLFNAPEIWDLGVTGAGIKVAILDTGLSEKHPHFKNIIEIVDWTNEKITKDQLGHGTFVSSLIAGKGTDCRGLAPDAEIYVFRVFTKNHLSYTSWFLDAFNYAIYKKIHILNLSIGGPDYNDLPFVDKVNEATSNGITIISAIGNDGPIYGTLNNPGDQMDVIGVSAITENDEICDFSSRGMSTWELPYGTLYFCRTLSGTSVASPIVAGSAALLASAMKNDINRYTVNPGILKQVLLEGASLIKFPQYDSILTDGFALKDGIDFSSNIFEQGAGKINLINSLKLIQDYEPHASIFPSEIDLTNCPYFWPYCTQPLYYSTQPIALNLTIVNGMNVVGFISEKPIFKQTSIEILSGDEPLQNSDLVSLYFHYPETIWPYSGYFTIFIHVKSSAQHFHGFVYGEVSFTVNSPADKFSEIVIPIKLEIIPTPSRNMRILWDQFHNINYPSGFFPRDDLSVKNDALDWRGDHIHTNFRKMYHYLRKKGYFIEVLSNPLTCFEAKNYGTLLIVDSEEEFFKEEIKKIEKDISEEDLSIIIFSEWYNLETIEGLIFTDKNTDTRWIPATGGANIPALNELLESYGIKFGDHIISGEFSISGESVKISSGTSISQFPQSGKLLFSLVKDDTTKTLEREALLGIYDPPQSKGSIVVFGDSSCLDETNTPDKFLCFQFLDFLLKYTSTKKLSSVLEVKMETLENPYFSLRVNPPFRRDFSQLYQFSNVLSKKIPLCIFPEDPFANFQRANNLRHNQEENHLIHSRSTRFSNSSLIFPISLIFFTLAFFIYYFGTRKSSAVNPSNLENKTHLV
ncbi:membrane-bound transcription factor site-1 protease [Anaeramoeba ignava]|uniref:Membrane-bound transcription factor site-1 protease n=1 Tax=Anaeramoeba ignava TaxID=1746090 RepID=A0A9Q0L879_ANAIG|nr:membrane-bound transcription factor site-1 protease [Anaeramoeba ignava]